MSTSPTSSRAFTVIAHRGLSGRAPENTAAAIEAAFVSGIGWVELDVSQLRDGTLVIWHDDDLGRCSNGHGPLVDHDWPDVEHLDCGAWFDRRYRNERMLRLQRALVLARRLRLGLNLELKAHAGDARLYIDAVEKALRQAGTDNGKLLVTSFDPELLALMKTRAPQRPLGVLTDAVHEGTWSLAKSLGARTIVAEQNLLLPEQVHEADRRGYGMITYTANQPDRIHDLIQAGLDGVISDFPERYSRTTGRVESG